MVQTAGMAAVQAMAALPLKQRLALAVPLLSDPARSVRIEAARLLAGTSPQLAAEGPTKNALGRAIAELVDSEKASAERPENHMNLASLYAQTNRSSEAETELQTALRLDPNFVPAMINLADLYRAEKREEEGQQLLLRAIAAAPNAAEPLHALGLMKVRQKNCPEALTFFRRPRHYNRTIRVIATSTRKRYNPAAIPAKRSVSWKTFIRGVRQTARSC